MRGLPLVVEYEVSGRIALVDAGEVLGEVQGDPLVLDGAMASCNGERFRLVLGHHVTAEGDHATLSLGTTSVDFGPVLDQVPASRFDPHLAAVRRGRRFAAVGEYAAARTALEGQELTDEERRMLVDEVMGPNAALGALRFAWEVVGQLPERTEVGLWLARAELDAADAVAAAVVLDSLPTAVGCMERTRLLVLQGNKRGARKSESLCPVDPAR